MVTGNLIFNYSRLSPASVKAAILPQFGITEADCRFFMLGLHDSYLITEGSRKYILRVYRNDWRSLSDIRFELELLTHIQQQCGRVAAPLCTRDNDFYVAIDSPEGVRYAALFSFAHGESVDGDFSLSQARMLGSTIAHIHRGTESFSSRHMRRELNLDFLLDESIPLLRAFLTSTQYQDLLAIQNDLHNKMPVLPDRWPETCYCSGDINLSNFHIDGDSITVFDFDQCGRGWRAFDIAKFFSSLLHLRNRQEIQTEFINGYSNISPLGKDEIKALPYLVCVAIIWVMSIQVHNIDLWGIKRLDARYWERKMQGLLKIWPGH